MQKLLRILLLVFVPVVIAAIVYTQVQLYVSPHRSEEKAAAKQSELVAELAQKPPVAAAPVASAPSAAPAVLGSEASPVVVKLAAIPDSPEDIAEREKDRDIQRGIEHYTERLAATSLVNNYLLLFQAVLFFLTLIILYMLTESVKKLAAAAERSAEAAVKSAEAAEARAKKNERHGARRFPPHFHRKR